MPSLLSQRLLTTHQLKQDFNGTIEFKTESGNRLNDVDGCKF